MSKKQIGIIIAIIGIAAIIISQTLNFRHDVIENIGMGITAITGTTENTTLKNIILFFGIALLIGGGIVLATGLDKKSD